MSQELSSVSVAVSRSVWSDLGQSWMALKTWVKVWLFFLNAVLLGALAFPDDPAGTWTIRAYVAAGPLLAAIAIPQRGLTRLLGIAHIVPWTPLVVYLGVRLGADAWGPRITLGNDPALFGYVVVLLATLVVCLAFDFYDLARWLRGERFAMGSPEACRAGASSLARRHAG